MKEKIPFSEWMERRALELYRERTRSAQIEARRKYVAGVKEQLVKIICKKQEIEPADFDEESYVWTEEYSLLGLDPRLDLDTIKIPRRADAPEPEDDEPDVENEDGAEGSDADAGNAKKPKKEINPADYDLGIEDLAEIAKRQAEQAARRAERKARNLDRARRVREGVEEVSEPEEEESEGPVDESGEPLRMTPKPRPFANAPVVSALVDIPAPAVHPGGFLWLMQELFRSPGVPCISPVGTHFSEVCVALFNFVGRPRGFPASRAERAKRERELKLQADIRRRQAEEAALRAAEAARVAEEARVAELRELRERFIRDEERRVVELAVPLRKYLSQTVLKELIDGLVETARVRPSDPVRFLGEFLMDRSVQE